MSKVETTLKDVKSRHNFSKVSLCNTDINIRRLVGKGLRQEKEEARNQTSCTTWRGPRVKLTYAIFCRKLLLR